jgi:hypothetical protein
MVFKYLFVLRTRLNDEDQGPNLLGERLTL